MNRAKIIDIIRSATRLRVDNKAGYKDHIALADLGNEDFVTVSNLAEAITDGKPSIGPIIAPAGDNVIIVVLFDYGLTPIVTALPRLGANVFSTKIGRLDYEFYYTDSTCTVLQSVWIYGNDDGSGNLNEDVLYSIVGNI